MYINRIEKFLVEATLLDHTNSDSIDISQFISSINVKRNYMDNSLPLFVIDMMTTQQVRDKMRDNEVSINVKVSKYLDVNSETTEDSDEQPVIDSVILNSTIRVYEKIYTTSSQKTEEENEDIDSESSTLQIIPYQIIGIPEELILKNSQVINEVYQDAKMNDILVHIASSIEPNEAFIDPSDNNEKEMSLIIPPLNPIPALKYLQDNYGIYNSSMGVFLDLDKTYIYKKFSKNRLYKNTFEVIVVAADDISSDQKFTTPLFDEDNNVRLYLKNTPDFISELSVNSDTIGETTIFNSYDYNFDGVRRVYNNDNIDNKKVRYYWNYNQSKIFEESFLDETIQVSEGTGITLSNIDPSYFSIDTLYVLSSPTEYANGTYILIDNTFTIFTNDYLHYNSAVHLKLTKLK
jgi:hypothetical protein